MLPVTAERAWEDSRGSETPAMSRAQVTLCSGLRGLCERPWVLLKQEDDAGIQKLRQCLMRQFSSRNIEHHFVLYGTPFDMLRAPLYFTTTSSITSHPWEGVRQGGTLREARGTQGQPQLCLLQQAT